ncbi:MAG: DUF3160 domain-containing protein [Deltaproteobacteria bacterium]|nr:DUF3160 domain-containing protein [Deltaproteobacteria bacterium]
MRRPIAIALSVAIVGALLLVIHLRNLPPDWSDISLGSTVSAAPKAQRRTLTDDFGAALDTARRRIGDLDLATFEKRYTKTHFKRFKPAWDPTTARYWTLCQKESTPCKLNPQETARFKRNGFVVSERLGASTFAVAYYNVYTHDLPVLITTDSILHAWHRSYDAVLAQLEGTYLAPSLGTIFDAMKKEIPRARAAYGDSVLKKGLGDAALFVDVARALIAGKESTPQSNVNALLKAILKERVKRVRLFGERRKIIFSQFHPRGHYANTTTLKRYFRAMMWLGSIDLRFDERHPGRSMHQLRVALVLVDLLDRAHQKTAWATIDQTIQAFVGETDSLTVSGLRALLRANGVASIASVHTPADLKRVYAAIMGGRAGKQQIAGHPTNSPEGNARYVLPRSFTMMGQRFTLDAWALSQLVFDRILWKGKKVGRRRASGLDVAFTTFGNDVTTHRLRARIHTTRGKKFRDGLPYHPQLAALREVIDALPRTSWMQNIYSRWLGTLRALSAPTTSPRFFAAMRSRAWAEKGLNTQLASWSQLRHDTILYVKQGVTFGILCDHPDLLVEPRPAFWATLQAMAQATARRLGGLPLGRLNQTKGIGIKKLQARWRTFFSHFAAQVGELHQASVAHLARKPLPPKLLKRLLNVVQIRHGSGFTAYNGWYPKLFYKGTSDAGKSDVIVADVLTTLPDAIARDPGAILYEGTSYVDSLVLAVDRGAYRALYVGPTFRHYEFNAPPGHRLDDKAWKKIVNSAQTRPPRPAWTHSYLVTTPAKP